MLRGRMLLALFTVHSVSGCSDAAEQTRKIAQDRTEIARAALANFVVKEWGSSGVPLPCVHRLLIKSVYFYPYETAGDLKEAWVPAPLSICGRVGEYDSFLRLTVPEVEGNNASVSIDCCGAVGSFHQYGLRRSGGTWRVVDETRGPIRM